MPDRRSRARTVPAATQRSNSVSTILTSANRWQLRRQTAAISASGSSASTDAPRAANRTVALPVPAPTSSTRGAPPHRVRARRRPARSGTRAASWSYSSATDPNASSARFVHHDRQHVCRSRSTTTRARPSTTSGTSAWAASPSSIDPAGTRRCRRSSADAARARARDHARRRMRHRLPDTPPERDRSRGSTRASRCSRSPASGSPWRRSSNRRDPAAVRGRQFERLVTGHFYGHLDGAERMLFLAEARRVASELVSSTRPSAPTTSARKWQTRILNDGSAFRVFKRYFDGAGLRAELGGGDPARRPLVRDGPSPPPPTLTQNRGVASLATPGMGRLSRAGALVAACALAATLARRLPAYRHGRCGSARPRRADGARVVGRGRRRSSSTSRSRSRPQDPAGLAAFATEVSTPARRCTAPTSPPRSSPSGSGRRRQAIAGGRGVARAHGLDPARSARTRCRSP